MKEFPRRFLSLRDKNDAHHRSRSAPPGNKHRPSGTDAFRALFKPDQPRHGNAKGETEEKIIEPKVRDVQHRLDELGITNVTVEHIKDIMATEYAEGDSEKTVELIDIEQKASAGIIVPYNPQIHMVGAENRGNVTCYLDSLLFAMFAKMDAFECVLRDNFPSDDNRSQLVNLLRIWVNMLRTGKLIRTDMTRAIQETLAECGWTDARELEQQDTSEAFAFLTETLQLPLLSLQVELFHQGKRDKDDHKVVYERLLNLAVPPDPEDKGIKLEDCLENYFNSRVDVLRDKEEGKKSLAEDRGPDNLPPLVNRNTLRIMTEGSESSATTTDSPVSMSAPVLPGDDADTNGQTISMERADPQPPTSASSETFPNDSTKGDGPSGPGFPARHRSTSVIQNIIIDESGRTSSTDDSTMLQRARRKGSTLVKAVTIPAWQFFKFIPWHAVKKEPQNNDDVAMNFDQRPVVGICLKRYLMTETGQFKRHNTYIDIPDSLRLPHFMLADGDGDESPGLDTDYKLVLQSVICHRGDMLQSGHYISFARVAPKLLTDNRRHDFDPPPDYEEAQWVRFDDLDLDGRVSYVDDIKQALKDEMPYLLFYQIMPMVDAPSTEDAEAEPPSYDEFKPSLESTSTSDAVQTQANAVRQHDDATPTPGLQSPPSKPPSIRFSTEVDLPRNSSVGTGLNSYSGSAQGDSRRQSVILPDSAIATPALTPDGNHSPAISPSDESTASRLSRAAARFKGRQSRPGSQPGENRVSSAMSRMAGLMMRPSKDALAEPTTLNISGSNSTGRPSLDNSNGGRTGSSPEPEKPAIPSRGGSPPQNEFKNGKTKDKHGKARPTDQPGEQPERECTVM